MPFCWFAEELQHW